LKLKKLRLKKIKSKIEILNIFIGNLECLSKKLQLSAQPLALTIKVSGN